MDVAGETGSAASASRSQAVGPDSGLAMGAFSQPHSSACGPVGAGAGGMGASGRGTPEQDGPWQGGIGADGRSLAACCSP
jgi:hypothetical protein